MKVSLRVADRVRAMEKERLSYQSGLVSLTTRFRRTNIKFEKTTRTSSISISKTELFDSIWEEHLALISKTFVLKSNLRNEEKIPNLRSDKFLFSGSCFTQTFSKSFYERSTTFQLKRQSQCFDFNDSIFEPFRLSKANSEFIIRNSTPRLVL